ncbi:MAG: class I SAM-dependent methyltransferase [Bdellovibrionales bacterium]
MWDDRYGDAELVFGEKPNVFLQDALKNIQINRYEESQPLTCLFLGCGEGRNMSYVKSLGHRVFGVDQSIVGINKALNNFNNLDREEFECADLLQWKSTMNFDLICSIWLHLPIGARQDIYELVETSLKDNGWYMNISYRKEQLIYRTGGPPTKKMMPSLRELQDKFSEYEIIIAHEEDKFIAEGKGHSGMSAVVEFLAKKERLVSLFLNSNVLSGSSLKRSMI